MLDFFKTARLYLAGKWGMKRRVLAGPDEVVTRPCAQDLTRLWKADGIRHEITRLRRNRKKHSHLQKQLDDLIAGGADNASQTENTK